MCAVPALVRSVSSGKAEAVPGLKRPSGIHKRPVDRIEIYAPGPSYGDGPGVVGDHVGDAQHHGGANKAVYAFAREELDWWELKLQRGL